MPQLTRWFIKAGLLYLVVAVALGGLMLAQSTLALPGWLALLRPVYLHLFMVGWVTQLIFGVVYWMFPKLTREQPRGSQRIGWAVFTALNLGLLLRVVVEPLTVMRPDLNSGWLLVPAALLQWLACVGFIANTWGRVKER